MSGLGAWAQAAQEGAVSVCMGVCLRLREHVRVKQRKPRSESGRDKQRTNEQSL